MDLIDRQAAIDAVNAYLGLSAVSRTIQNMTSIQEILENLPSAEPERKKGKWNQIISIPNDMYGRYYCSECGKEGNPFWYFCPNCGADMRQREDDNV